jgi:hypothetical protein
MFTIGASPTNTEVIITTAASADGRQVWRQTRNFYVNDADAWQYAELSPAATAPAVRVNVVAARRQP